MGTVKAHKWAWVVERKSKSLHQGWLTPYFLAQWPRLTSNPAPFIDVQLLGQRAFLLFGKQLRSFQEAIHDLLVAHQPFAQPQEGMLNVCQHVRATIGCRFALGIGPDILDGIEFRRVRRKPFHLQPVLVRAQISRDLRAPMRGQMIPQEDDLSGRLLVQRLQIREDRVLFNTLGLQMQQKGCLAAIGPAEQRADHMQTLPVEVGRDRRGLSLRCPRAAYTGLERESTLIQEG